MLCHIIKQENIAPNGFAEAAASVQYIAAIILMVTRQPVSCIELTGQQIKEFSKLIHFSKRYNITSQDQGLCRRSYWLFLSKGIIVGTLQVEIRTVLNGHVLIYSFRMRPYCLHFYGYLSLTEN